MWLKILSFIVLSHDKMDAMTTQIRLRRGCYLLILSLVALCLGAQSEKRLVTGEHEIFKVSKAQSSVLVDGKLDEEDWKLTEVRSFDHFYRVETPSDRQQTKFRMLWDEKNLYVFFECQDQFLTARETERDGQPYFDDCAEIFLIPAPDSLMMHYGFELNLYKASNDFVFLNSIYQEKSGLVRAFNPDFEVEVMIDGTINDQGDLDQGWNMEMAIPIKLFHGMDQFSPVKKGNRWAFQAVRQERNDAEGNRRSTSTIFPIYDISKNVHQPNRFGLLEFVD